jgi:phosphatidylglycerophosphate synthase
VALRSRFPEYVTAVTTPVGRGVARTGVSPNTLTTMGIVLTVVATWLVAVGEPVLGGWVLVAGGLMDLFDGAVARATDRATPFGSFYDSVSDRVSDGVILAGIAWWLRDNPRLFLLAVVALVGAQITSYVRAKAEAIDLDCSVGIMERAERAILLMAALIFNRWLLEPILWILAIGSTVTVVQRVHHVWCQIDRDIPAELLALAARDRAWSRAFKAAARRFYGERNFDGALDDHNSGRGNGGERAKGPAEPSTSATPPTGASAPNRAAPPPSAASSQPTADGTSTAGASGDGQAQAPAQAASGSDGEHLQRIVLPDGVAQPSRPARHGDSQERGS